MRRCPWIAAAALLAACGPQSKPPSAQPAEATKPCVDLTPLTELRPLAELAARIERVGRDDTVARDRLATAAIDRLLARWTAELRQACRTPTPRLDRCVRRRAHALQMTFALVGPGRVNEVPELAADLERVFVCDPTPSEPAYDSLRAEVDAIWLGQPAPEKPDPSWLAGDSRAARDYLASRGRNDELGAWDDLAVAARQAGDTHLELEALLRMLEADDERALDPTTFERDLRRTSELLKHLPDRHPFRARYHRVRATRPSDAEAEIARALEAVPTVPSPATERLRAQILQRQTEILSELERPAAAASARAAAEAWFVFYGIANPEALEPIDLLLFDLLDIDPRLSRELYDLGDRILARAGQPTSTLRRIRVRAAVLSANGEPAEAIALLEKQRTDPETRNELLFEISSIQIDHGMWDAAIASTEQWWRGPHRHISPASLMFAHRNLGHAHRGKGNWKQAADYYHRAHRRAPKPAPRFLLWYAQSLIGVPGKRAAAITAAKQAQAQARAKPDAAKLVAEIEAWLADPKPVPTKPRRRR